MAVATEQIHEKLIAHFDQVWTVHFEPSKRCLYKDQDKQGQLAPENTRKPSKQRMLDAIRKSLNMPLADQDDAVEPGPKKAKLCAQSTLVPVDYQRVARTTTTLSWSTGDMGRAYITAPASVVQGA